jgi:TfoX/Sxy family transcriptional regulator of competence genes
VYLVFKEIATNLGNIEYKSLFMYPAVLKRKEKMKSWRKERRILVALEEYLKSI